MSVERYKCFTGNSSLEIAPLTILVGANNSGKTALAQAIHLLASSLTRSGDDLHEPLLMSSGGIRHGKSFVDLVNGRSIHGKLSLSAELVNEHSESSLQVTIQNVERPPKPAERQILNWSLSSGDNRIEAQRKSLDPQSSYDVSVSGGKTSVRHIAWQGLLPRSPSQLADWVDIRIGEIKKWANGVRYLKCPRNISSSRFTTEEYPSGVHEASGMTAPMTLAADDNLQNSVREWYRRAFGVTLDIKTEGRYFDLTVRPQTNGTNVLLDQSGSGLSQVLPVAVTALTAKQSGPGVDIIEHPEADLHPASHAHVAELLLENLSESGRSMVIETHSEMVLLRTRRWIAERLLSPEDVLVYWVHMDPDHGSIPEKITINERGQMERWPDGVFTEDYEEVLAIRRAVAQNGVINPDANRN